MKCLTGKSVSDQIVIAPLLFYQKTMPVNNLSEETPGEACDRILGARDRAVAFCREMIHKASVQRNEVAQKIFEAQEMLLTDDVWEQKILDKILKSNLSAAMAVVEAGQELKNEWIATGDEYISARIADIEDVTGYYLRALGVNADIGWTDMLQTDAELTWTNESGNGNHSFIVMAQELTPADTMRLPREYLKGFVTQKGSSVSHVSILAGSLGIPALYGVEVSPEYNGCMAILDADRGELIIEPEEVLLASYREALRVQREEKIEAHEDVRRGGEFMKRYAVYDGQHIYANVADVQSAVTAFEKGAEGIGLYRSECLWMSRNTAPTEEEQYQVYRSLLEAAGEREVVIRVLDIGSDKITPAIPMKEEHNPALGKRGIRFLLENKELFLTQLRALYRASKCGRLSILFPMITSLEEVIAIRKICEDIEAEVETESDFRDALNKERVRLGMMIETPAAALITDLIAAECDFISIGTNDLTQYLMAADRNSELADAYPAVSHPAMERLLAEIIMKAHEAGCKVCICGELAAEPKMAERFCEWKVDVLSVNF